MCVELFFLANRYVRVKGFFKFIWKIISIFRMYLICANLNNLKCMLLIYLCAAKLCLYTSMWCTTKYIEFNFVRKYFHCRTSVAQSSVCVVCICAANASAIYLPNNKIEHTPPRSLCGKHNMHLYELWHFFYSGVR